MSFASHSTQITPVVSGVIQKNKTGFGTGLVITLWVKREDTVLFRRRGNDTASYKAMLIAKEFIAGGGTLSQWRGML